MCMQCMAGAMTATTGAAGLRVYLASRQFSWMTPKRLRRITVGLLGAAVLGSATLISGTPTDLPPSGPPAAQVPTSR